MRSRLRCPTTRLAHLIPEAWFADDYVGRKVGGVQDFDLLDAAYKLKYNVILEGPTGSAKTSLIYAWAAKRGLPVVNVPCNGAAEPRSMFGGWVAQPDGSLIFVRGDLYLAAQYGGVGYFDEVNMMPPRIASVVHGLFDKRRTLTVLDAAGSQHPTVVQAHPDFFLIAAYNPGYTDTFDLNEAFKNRFAFKVVWDYDRTVEEELVSAVSLLDLADDLRRRVEDGTLRTPVPTNMLIEFERSTRPPGWGSGSQWKCSSMRSTRTNGPPCRKPSRATSSGSGTNWRTSTSASSWMSRRTTSGTTTTLRRASMPTRCRDHS